MTQQIESELYGLDLFGEAVLPDSRGPLADTFVIPPFTVLDAKQGFWQERKRLWINMGIKSEIGRDDNLMLSSTGFLAEEVAKRGGGTSVFDPVLCELLYRWFVPTEGQVLDPYAGGSVRGIVAARMNLQYIGIDLRIEQVEANFEQAHKLHWCHPPNWICGDSRDEIDNVPEADFVFSCPPYGVLESYSDDPRDLSNMGFDEFFTAYHEIILKACAKLKNNRFACFTVGNYRDPKTGNYIDLVGETVKAFKDAGLGYYNEAVLLTAIGTLPIRTGKQFKSGRKLGKAHQNVLIFLKGDCKLATEACAPVDI
jgi:hypothetical protein